MMDLVPWRRRRKEDWDVPAIPDFFDRFFRELEPVTGGEGRMLTPDFDVSETEDKIIVKSDLPGIDPEDVDISVTGNTLTVRGEKKREEEKKGEHYHRVERRYGSFSRSLALPEYANPDKVDAKYKNGVLRVEIPKTEKAARKKIEIKTS
jgi:HSP20 family protein